MNFYYVLEHVLTTQEKAQKVFKMQFNALKFTELKIKKITLINVQVDLHTYIFYL